MEQKRFELEVESRIQNLPVIADFLSGALEQLGANPATAYKVQLVVDEACTNLIMHAYAGSAGHIKLELEKQGSDLVINIKDKGKPFDPANAVPPDLDAGVEERKIGGLGIYFMKRLMDSVSYSSEAGKGNVLTLKTRLTGT